MDSFSGSSPLDFISFYLDMSSEEHNEIIPATATGTLTEEEVPQQPEETVVDQTATAIKDAESKQPDPPKDSSSKTGPTSSASTDDSISAYIERQLQNLGCQDTGLAISFLPPTTSAVVSHAPESNTEKVSESEPIPQVTTGSRDKESPETEIERGNDAVSEAGFSVTKADYFQTDTSDAEELLDSSGAETIKEPPFLIALDALSSTGTEIHEEAKPATSAELPNISSSVVSLTSRTKLVSRVSTLWSLRCEAPTALFRSVSGRANPSMSSACYDTGLLQNLLLVSCWYFPVSCPSYQHNLRL